MKVFTAPEAIDTEDTTVFLAGGITNCTEWQKDCIRALEPIKVGAILNPRRESYPHGDLEAMKEQISWEFNALNSADILSMWFASGNSEQPICLYELGRHLALIDNPNRICIGVDPGYKREQDVYIQTQLAHPDIKIATTLEEHIENIKKALSLYPS